MALDGISPSFAQLFGVSARVSASPYSLSHPWQQNTHHAFHDLMHVLPYSTSALSHQRRQVASGSNALRFFVRLTIARITMPPAARVKEVLFGANGRQGFPCDVHSPGSTFWWILHGDVVLLRGLPTGQLQSQNQMHQLTDAVNFIILL